MAQLNLSLDKIIHPSRDPSKPLPWWDKSRLHLHGRFTSQIEQAHIIYHVSMDPYNRTEEMKWCWSDLFFDWTNMLMIFKGTLDIYLNTESKYDECRLLHLPNLELKIKIDWICKQQFNQIFNTSLANFHNYVIPCARDKLPVIVNSSIHDSFSQFRSENINISLSFICDLDNLIEANTVKKLPTFKFYASTSRFLERIKNLLSSITRPIKRGKLFQNLRPRKPILSRHFKNFKLHLDIPKLNIIYWSSASEEYGVQLECEHFFLDSSHKLSLIPILDKLKRRPKPCWSTEIMKSKLRQIKIYLMAPNGMNTKSNTFNNKIEINNFKTQMSMQNELFIMNNYGMKSFFMQIDSIFYEQEKNCNYNIFNCNNHSSYSPTYSNNNFKLTKTLNRRISKTSMSKKK
jgi:hypothetical protein